jgi:hypothetical protein
MMQRFFWSVVTALSTAAWIPVAAQITAQNQDVRSKRGQGVSPIYEGWYEFEGGVYALFGYFNRNTEEIVDLPVGSANQVSPGETDQGQPTRFSPGRQYGVVAIRVPKASSAKTEVSWSLTANGQTFSIPATLDQLYLLTPQRDAGGLDPGNTPPLLKFDASGTSVQGPAGVVVRRRTTARSPLPLDVWLSDDGLPVPRGERGPGLSVAWSVYRGGPGTVTFANAAPPIEGGRASTTATFSAAGQYMLRVRASDGSRPSGTFCCWTHGSVVVDVTADSSKP